MALPLIPLIGGVLVLIGIFGRRLGLLGDPPESADHGRGERQVIVHNHYHGIEQEEPRPKRGRPTKRRMIDPNPYEVEETAEPEPAGDGDGEVNNE